MLGEGAVGAGRIQWRERSLELTFLIVKNNWGGENGSELTSGADLWWPWIDPVVPKMIPNRPGPAKHYQKIFFLGGPASTVAARSNAKVLGPASVGLATRGVAPAPQQRRLGPGGEVDRTAPSVEYRGFSKVYESARGYPCSGDLV